MKCPLSQNELIILDRQLAMVGRHLSAITALLESRLGETDDSAVSARMIEAQFASLAENIHSQATQTDDEELPLISRYTVFED